MMNHYKNHFFIFKLSAPAFLLDYQAHQRSHSWIKGNSDLWVWLEIAVKQETHAWLSGLNRSEWEMEQILEAMTLSSYKEKQKILSSDAGWIGRSWDFCLKDDLNYRSIISIDRSTNGFIDQLFQLCFGLIHSLLCDGFWDSTIGDFICSWSWQFSVFCSWLTFSVSEQSELGRDSMFSRTSSPRLSLPLTITFHFTVWQPDLGSFFLCLPHFLSFCWCLICLPLSLYSECLYFFCFFFKRGVERNFYSFSLCLHWITDTACTLEIMKYIIIQSVLSMVSESPQILTLTDWQ